MKNEVLLLKIAELEDKIKALPNGSITYKTIRGKKQPYLQWREYGKVKSKYIKLNEREQIFTHIALRKELQDMLALLREQVQPIYEAHEAVAVYGSYRTRVLVGEELLAWAKGVEQWQKREVFDLLWQYLDEATRDKVCILYGLRRTGKTTLLRQAVLQMRPSRQKLAAYIKARTTDDLGSLNHDLQLLWKRGYRYIFIDEVTLLEDFIDGAALFSDVYAAQGMHIVLSGTDSLGFWLSQHNELYDRAKIIHTTFIPYREHARLLGSSDIDEYIRYGGTLRAGSIDFANVDEQASFYDDESTRQYIDTAICKNIQHGLTTCQAGNYLRHLQALAESGELTGAINRIIEDMNHRFLLSVLQNDFKSHDFGSAAQLLRRESNPSKRTDILDNVDRQSITERLMQLLDIKNKAQQKVNLTEAHVYEIKEYLEALELIAACPVYTMSERESAYEYTIFIQPGMRYCQAQALVYALLQDKAFNNLSEKLKLLVSERILEDVRGRMLEDIVLFETMQSSSKKQLVGKLKFAVGEYDMLIYDKEQDSCEVYEIKHSQQYAPNQCRYLLDEDMLAQTAGRFGRITKRCVLYRGAAFKASNGIEYENVEEYLKRLK